MLIQIIKLKSRLPEEELLAVSKERAPQFRAIPGLVQKYYVKLDQPGHYGGLNIWDSKESLMQFRQSELAASIPVAYELMEPPEVEILEVMYPLRELPDLRGTSTA